MIPVVIKKQCIKDYKNEKVDHQIFTAVLSGIISPGASFIKDMLKGKAKGNAIDAAVKGAEKWIRETTALFLNRELVASIDRNSTRLNSNHVSISYAVFCLKKTTINAVST